MPTGAELFVDAMMKLGIHEIFTLVGDHLNEVLSVAGARGIRIIDFRHESGVTHAADAWGRIHRRPAISLVTGGPGHTNSLTGIATAFQAASPLIAVSGAPSSALAGRQVFQVIDQVGMAAPVCKWAAQPASTGQIPFYLGRAYQEAISGRMGPVHLTIPVDLFAGSADSALSMPEPVRRPEMAPSGREVARALELLEKAERPIVIAGSGVWWAGAGVELRRFLNQTNLPYYSVTMARGIIPDTFRNSMGYADGALNKAVHQAFPEADVVLVLGKRIDYRLALGGPRLFSPKAKFIQVDIVAQELGLTRPLELGICADVKSTLHLMNEMTGDPKGRSPRWPGRTAWLRRQRTLRDLWRAQLAGTAADRSKPIHPAAFFSELAKALPPATLFAWDGGDFIHWGRAIIPAMIPGGWLRLGPLGTIGSALPNSMALQLANPGAPVVMITGDGSLGFYLAELDTMVRHNLPVVIIVGNDAGWGLERELQGEFCGSTVACELRATRYDLIMQGFGGEGENIERLDQVGPAIRRAFKSRKPYLLNVNVRGARSPFTEWQISGKKKK
ncbi:MAG: thiamine pyrophosphate-binding protein [Acidobacteriia bacterium]|nr:thiamine pyrophosphate-binding protein [Terriglobia bacterium]